MDIYIYTCMQACTHVRVCVCARGCECVVACGGGACVLVVGRVRMRVCVRYLNVK